jgi:hypothetical protein
MVAVTCAVVAAVVVYTDAVVALGVRSTIDNADARDRTIEVTLRAPTADVADVTARLGESTLDVFDTAVFAVSSSYRITEPLLDDMPSEASESTAVITRVATFDGDDLWREVSGGLAELATAAASAPVPAVIHADAAALLGIGTGDRVRLDPAASGRSEGLDLRVVGLVAPSDPLDPRWFAQSFGRVGSTTSGSFTEVGPFFVAPVAFARIGGDASYTARLAVDSDRVEPGDIDETRLAADRAPETYGAALAPVAVRVETGLGDLLSNTDTSVRSTAAVVAAVLLQVAAVALFGLSVAAAAVVASRRGERILLHARGISTGGVVSDALVEALVIAVPAAIIGPLLATVAVEFVGRWGPIASTGLEVSGDLSGAAFAMSAIAAGIAVASMVVPAFTAVRVPPTEVAQPADAPLLRRTGLDIVLVVLAVVGLWQLQRTGSVASSAEPGGRVSVDPVLVLAPTLAIAAASLIAVRMLGIAANGLERIGARSRRLAPALAGREAARSGGRRNRSSVLVVVSVAVASFALIQAASWERSQRDQADAAVGADVIVVPDGGQDAALSGAELASGYRALDGVTAIAPIADRSVAVPAQARPVALVSLDAEKFATFSRTRSDIVAETMTVTGLAAPVDLRGVALPADGGELSATISLAAAVTTADGEQQPTPTRVEISMVVTDEFGTIRRLPASEPITTADGRATTATVSFGRIEPSASVDRPSRLVEIGADVPVAVVEVGTSNTDIDGDGVDDASPLEVPSTRAEIGLVELDVGGARIDVGSAPWTPFAPEPTRFTISRPEASVVAAGPTELRLAVDAGTTAQRQASVQFRFATADPAAFSTFADGMGTVDVLATAQLVEDLAVVGDTPVAARIGANRMGLRIVGETGAVPFAADEPLAFLADHATLAAAEYLASGARSEPDRWVLAVDESERADITSMLETAPFDSALVIDRWTQAEQRTSDPILVGLTGSLLMAVGAVAIVAFVGLLMAAVTGARDRRGANAVLRALGASRRELRQWLLAETVPMGVLSITIGVATGVAIAAVVLRSLTGDREGGEATPPPELVMPWPALLVLVVVGLVAVAMVPPDQSPVAAQRSTG